MKINLDKYYTPVKLANYCYGKVIELIGEENISDIVEPSDGNGDFFNHPITKMKPIVGDKVIWYDPAIDARDLSRVCIIDKITDEIVYISDDFSESEVFANELLKKH